MLTIESTTIERLQVEVTTSSDPTGNPPEFAVSTSSEPGAFANGSWVGSWNTTTGKIMAQTPLLGAGQSLDVADGSTYRLYARWTVGDQTPTTVASILQVT